MSLSIQRYQIDTKEKETSRELLKEGNRVSSYEANKKLNEFFENKIPGLPYFKPYNFKKGEVARTSHFNDMFKDIKEDLDTIYDIYNINVEDCILNKENCDSHMLRLRKNMDFISLHAEILDEYARKNISYEPHVITFFNLKEVNSKDLTDKNTPKSTCEIDFETSTLRNVMHSSPNDKLDLMNSIVKIETDNLTNFDNIDNDVIFSESNENSLNLEVDSLTNVIPNLFITIDLKENKYASRVELKANSITNAKVKLFLSEDGINFLEKEELKGNILTTFRFPKENIRAFRLQIIKESEDLSTRELKKFLYSIVNISVYNDKYEKDCVYVSKQIEFKNTSSDIIINPIHNTPPGTSINYFVSYAEKDEKSIWFNAEPNVPVDLNLLTKVKKFLNYDTEECFGGKYNDTLFKENVFKICEIQNNSNINSIDLRAGLSQFFIERLNVRAKEGKADPKDYNKRNVVAVAPLDASLSEIKCEEVNNYIVLTSYVICNEDTIIEDRFIKFNKESETFDYVLLVNGKQIFPKKDKFNFKLKKGENIINIMLVLEGLNVSNLANTKTIKHNFNILSQSEAMYAGPKMKKVSYNSLIKNVDKNSLKYYSIKEINGKNYIVVKFDPNFVLKPTDPKLAGDANTSNSEYFRIMLNYKYLDDTIKQNITNKDGNSNIRVRVMARLTSSNISTTPALKGIKVVAE